MDFIQCAVEGRGFSAAGRPGHEHHAVRPGNGAPKPSQIVGGIAQQVQLQPSHARGDVLFIQDPDDDGFAVGAGENRDPEIDGPAFDAEFESAVLRNSSFRNVKFGHDFQSRDERIVQGRRQRVHGVIQHAVNSELHVHASFSGFEVDVAGVFLERA